MLSGFKGSRLDVGQIRLLHLIARSYKVTPEEIVNRLIQEYNELHLDAIIEKSVYEHNPGRILGVVEVGEALARKSEKEFMDSLKIVKYPSVKLAKEQQVQTIEEGLDALHRMQDSER